MAEILTALRRASMPRLSRFGGFLLLAALPHRSLYRLTGCVLPLTQLRCCETLGILPEASMTGFAYDHFNRTGGTTAWIDCLQAIRFTTTFGGSCNKFLEMAAESCKAVGDNHINFMPPPKTVSHDPVFGLCRPFLVRWCVLAFLSKHRLRHGLGVGCGL